MNSTETAVPPMNTTTADSRRGAGASLLLWCVGVLCMAAATWFGIQVEGQLHQAPLGPLDPGQPLVRQVAPWFFAFGFPVGLALCALATRLPRPDARTGPWPLLAAAGLLVAAPVLVSVLAGRAPSPGFFGTGGVVIALCAVLTFLVLGRLRRTLPGDLRVALDLLVWGLACFAVAAWNLCGTAAMPSHLLSPETVLRLGTLPFAIGQMKTVQALLAVGWVLVLLAALAALRRRPAPPAGG